jgi:heme oxygenase
MISDYIPEEILPDINERYKSELILQDLDYFGKKPGAIPMPADLPLINSIATAFGALFVFESLTLSNSLIYDMLLNDKNLLNENNSFSFFSAYDDVTEEKWKLFISVLNKQDENEGIIKGALDNYRMFQNWIINTL